MFTFDFMNRAIGALDCCPWGASVGRREHFLTEQRGDRLRDSSPMRGRPLYTADQRKRRDSSPWTMVQGVLAPLQFAVFLISLMLVMRYLTTGQGLTIATASIVIKTIVLYTIMVTPAFFWEDVVSMLVLTLHTTYLIALFSGAVDAERQMWLAIAAYATYLANATQFVLKLRAARLQEHMWTSNSALGHTS